MNIYLMKKPKRVNAVSITLGLLGLVLVYVVWFLVPAFWPVFQLTGIMKGVCNHAYRERDDTKLMAMLMKDAARTRLKLSKENFRLTRVPYTEEELLATAVQGGSQDLQRLRGKECVLEMIYQDTYEWPLIGTKTDLTFRREVRTELSAVKYDKACTCVTTSQP